MFNIYGRDMVPVNLAADTTWTDESKLPVGLYVVGAGNVHVATVANGDRTIPVTDFSFMPCGVRKVFSTANGTTATGVWAIFDN